MRRELIVHNQPKSPISESFRKLRTSIQFMNSTRKMQTLLVTSTFPKEGKSWVTSNLAATFTQAGKKVILIDADMRKGRQYNIFAISPKPGLSNYLSEVNAEEETERSLREKLREYVQQTDVENLDVMSAGSVPPNPSELLISNNMLALIDACKKEYDLVIFDGTPCDLVTDATILSRIVDSTIVVTAYKITKKDNLQKVIKNLKDVGANISGVIVNKIPMSANEYTSTYYYGMDKGKSRKKR